VKPAQKQRNYTKNETLNRQNKNGMAAGKKQYELSSGPKSLNPEKNIDKLTRKGHRLPQNPSR
jgi:hypothetical protein